MNYYSTTSSWRVDLILTMRDIYINTNLNPLTKFISSCRNTELKDTLPWNISQMITKTVPFSAKIGISYAMKRGILLWIWWKVSGNWEKNMIRNWHWRESHCRTNNSIQKSRIARITVWNPIRKVDHLSKVICDRNINRAH